ncbi:U3 small nucleolar RNA-associated protein 14 [Tetrabaena socialis]|uniref:U3 small nucleolar RNA-associated protein 14 n=1 Tax=Tetrabaena socialis TaxID=47790 RepID=A0A2J8A7G6_9CHLO|nr:U3 small nucleolar RNA-associated protein 14 [Tetrabaena socialis]|eukprot:PNH08472.1 U3 small nucleolar RNA-associated protein 14 [Tetrabaena socialis]
MGGLSLADLLGSLTAEEKRKLGSARRLLERVGGGGAAADGGKGKGGLRPVSVPLPSVVADRQERRAGYEAASAEVTRWQPIVKEIDIHCERSGWQDTGQAIARALGLSYMFVCEFEELHSPLRSADAQGGGVHGNAILSKYDITDANREAPTLRLVSGREEVARVTTTAAIVAQHTPDPDNALEAEVAALLAEAGAGSAEAIEEAEEKLALKEKEEEAGAQGKFDWALLRGCVVVSKSMGNEDYSASDHKWLAVEWLAAAGPGGWWCGAGVAGGGGDAGRPAKRRREGGPKRPDNDVYEAEDSDPDEVKHAKRFDDVENYEYELPSDFEDEEIDEDNAFTEEDKKKYGGWFDKEAGGDEQGAVIGDDDGEDYSDEDEQGAEGDDEDDEGGIAPVRAAPARRRGAATEEDDDAEEAVGSDDFLFSDDDGDGDDEDEEGGEEEEEVDEEQHLAMLRDVLAAAGGDAGTRKRARRDPNASVLSEAYPESEYNLNPGAASAGVVATHVVVSEKYDKKATKYTAPAAPFPFTSPEAYERSIRQPLGREYNPDAAFRDLTRPAVIKQAGAVIAPLRYSEPAAAAARKNGKKAVAAREGVRVVTVAGGMPRKSGGRK